MAIGVRALTTEERSTIERLVHSLAAPVRLVRRAWIIKLAAEGKTAPAIAECLAIAEKVARLWVQRFNAQGVPGLDDAPRSGHPRTYTEEQRSRVIAKARGLPPKPADGTAAATCHWTLDDLQEELNKDGLPIKRSQIRRILKAEHIKWQKPRSWLDSDDPEFAEKRGPSSRSTPTPLLAAPS